MTWISQDIIILCQMCTYYSVRLDALITKYKLKNRASGVKASKALKIPPSENTNEYVVIIFWVEFDRLVILIRVQIPLFLINWYQY